MDCSVPRLPYLKKKKKVGHGMERKRKFEKSVCVKKTEREEFQKCHSGFQCTRQIIVCKSNFACPETLQCDENFISILKRKNYLAYSSMTCIFSLLLLDFCCFYLKYCIQNLCCLISVVLTGDVISLTEALTAVKALLKAMLLCYHNKQFVYFYCHHGKRKYFPTKHNRNRKR